MDAIKRSRADHVRISTEQADARRDAMASLSDEMQVCSSQWALFLLVEERSSHEYRARPD